MKISIDEKVFDMVNRLPQTKDILIDLGFSQLANDAMFNTVAKLISLRKAAGMQKIEFNEIKDAFAKHSITIEEESF